MYVDCVSTENLTIDDVTEAMSLHPICCHFVAGEANLTNFDFRLAIDTVSTEFINSRLSTGQTPLLIAVYKNGYDSEAVQLLVKRGADFNVTGAVFHPDVNQPGMMQATWCSPAHLALWRNKQVQSLLKQTKLCSDRSHVSIDVRQWATVWMMAVETKNEPLINLLVRVRMISLSNIDSDEASQNVWFNALTDAITGGYIEAVKCLLDREVDPKSKLLDCTVLVTAAKTGHQQVCEMLIAKGAALSS